MDVGPLQVEGVDYAWSRPDIAALAAAGKTFAFRYGGPGSPDKQLDPVEAQALSAAGLAIVANAEGAADGLLGGWSTGVAWARQAHDHFVACAMPPDRPIYLSVDFDVQSRQWPAVASALRGAASVLGGHRVGVYGGRRAIEWARRDGVAQWFWQTYAWSSGIWVPGNHVEQYRNGVPFAGGVIDLNRALTSDYGQWMTGDEMATAGFAENANNHGWSITQLDPQYEVRPGNDPASVPITVDNRFVQRFLALAADVAELKARPPVQPAPVDPAVVVAAVRAALADPAVLASIARAVADEDHRRSAA
jgi:hypothetical protein